MPVDCALHLLYTGRQANGAHWLPGSIAELLEHQPAALQRFRLLQDTRCMPGPLAALLEYLLLPRALPGPTASPAAAAASPGPADRRPRPCLLPPLPRMLPGLLLAATLLLGLPQPAARPAACSLAAPLPCPPPSAGRARLLLLPRGDRPAALPFGLPPPHPAGLLAEVCGALHPLPAG